MDDRAIEANIRKLKALLSAISLPLVAYEAEVPDAVQWERGAVVGIPVETATGFLVERDGRHYLLTAAHAVEQHRWYIELVLKQEPEWESRGVLVPIPQPAILRRWIDLETRTAGKIDFAWAHIDLRAALAGLDEATRRDIAPQAFRGPLDGRPSRDEVYSFVAFNQPGVYPGRRPGITVLERQPCVELSLTFARLDVDGNYRFALNHQHPGHAHYRGASGAPIADDAGQIISILIGGDPDADELIGAPLADFSGLIGLIES